MMSDWSDVEDLISDLQADGYKVVNLKTTIRDQQSTESILIHVTREETDE